MESCLKEKGKLYRFLSGRTDYANTLKVTLQETLIETEGLIKGVETETQTEIKELRSIYINSIISKLENFKNFQTTEEINNIEALEDDHFNYIRSAKDIRFYKFIHSYSDQYNLRGPQSSKITLESIEKEISKIPYDQREKNLTGKKNGEIERLKKRLKEIKEEIAEIDSYGIKEIFEKTTIDQYIEDFKESDLIRYLLLNGFINENYNDYISVFHAVNLTQEDFTFEAKVKNGISLPYEYPLHNTGTVLERLQNKYFKREAIWNYTLLDELLRTSSIDAIKKEFFFETLKPASEKVFDFVSGYIDKEPKNLGKFIKQLIKHKVNFWSYLFNSSNYTGERINAYIKLIFNYAEYDDINKMDEIFVLSEHLAEIPHFIDFVTSFPESKSVFKFIRDTYTNIKVLDKHVDSPNEVFDFIFKNNAYEITQDNIKAIFDYFKIDFVKEQYNNSNYTLLKEFAPPELLEYLVNNINLYIRSLVSELSENHNESEDSIIDMLNNRDLAMDLKQKFIEHQTNKITNLSQIINKTDKEIALIFQASVINWDNVYDYFKSLEVAEFDETIINYLNSEDIYIPLSASKIRNIKDADEDAIKEFCKNLIYTDKLNIKANTSLLKSIPYVYSNMDYTKPSEDKVTWMISNKVVVLTVENFDAIKKQFKYLHIHLLAKNEKDFILRYGEFSLTGADLELLFKSTDFSHSGKLEIIEAIDDSIIIENPKIAELVCYMLPDDKSFPLRYEIFEAMFAANQSVDKKIRVLNVNNEKFDNIQLQGFLEKFGEDYARLFVKQNKPVFANKIFNKDLFEILQSRNMISSFAINPEKEEIKVVANY